MKGLDKWIKQNSVLPEAKAGNQCFEDASPGPLPREIEVCLYEGKHPKTSVRQWQGSYIHGRDRRRVVCQPWQTHFLPENGKMMIVSLNPEKQGVPGMIFGRAKASVTAKRLFEQGELEVVISDLRCYRRTAYGRGFVVEWQAEAKLLDGEVDVRIEVPQGAEVPQLGEVWKVKRIGRSTSLMRTYSAKPTERISEPTSQPIPTEEFVFRFPDHDNNGHPLEHNGWPLAYEGWHVGDYRCRFKCFEGNTMHIEVLGFATESTETWIRGNLTAGKHVSVGFENDCDGEFGQGGNLVEVSLQVEEDGVDLWLTLEDFGGIRKEVQIRNAGLVNGVLQGQCKLFLHSQDLEPCYVSTH